MSHVYEQTTLDTSNVNGLRAPSEKSCVSWRPEAGPSPWEQLWTRSAHIGAVATVKMITRKALRPLSRARKRWRLRHASSSYITPDIVSVFGQPGESLDGLTEQFRKKLSCSLPVGPQDAQRVVEFLSRWAPEAKAQILNAADLVCQHVFDLLGSGPVSLGGSIDWHKDFKAGYRWDPALSYLDVPYGHVPGVDIKVPWELSRCQHLPLLAQAYWLSGDEHYTEELVSQILHWIENNPPGRGVNWACPMDVAIRAVNWIWAVGLAADSPAVTAPFLKTLLTSFLAHGRHVFNNLEVRDDGITTNHYIADIVGLLYMGFCLPESQETAGWRCFAVNSLVKEMDAQVFPDGVHYESSLSYHRFVTEMFLSGAALCRHHGQELSQPFWSRLERMCDFVMAYTKPNGLAPQIGDGDNGRFHVLTGYGTFDSRDHRHLLALGDLLYNRQDWLASAGPYWIEALWFGAHRQATWKKPPAHPTVAMSSRAFEAAGFYILRHHDDYVFFNCGAPGTRGIGTHKHNDVLSLEVQFGGEDIVVDAGSFLYTSDPQAYERFRSTRFHSTVTVDRAEQNRFIPGKLFCLYPDSEPRVRHCATTRSVETVMADHDGYDRLIHPVRHRRELRYESAARSFEIRDQLVSDQRTAHPHRLEWMLLFAPGCRLDRHGKGWRIATRKHYWLLGGPNVAVEGRLVSIEPQLEEAETAPSYGILCPATAIRWSWEGPLPVESRFEIRPFG